MAVMNSKAARGVLLFLLSLVTLAGCSGGGGGGGAPTSDPVPTLLAATFFGPGAAPAAGDTLLLVLSEPAALSGAAFDATDLEVGNGSLGTVAAGPSIVSTYVVSLTLGAGVSLTAGTSTLQFASANDAVTDGSGQAASTGTARTLTKGDAADPTLSGLTLSGVSPALNGTGAAGGTLQVATTGFRFDLAYTDGTGVDPALNIVTANVPVLVHGVNLAAGHNLLPSLTAGTVTATDATYTVPAGVVFPVGRVTLTAYVIDTTGRMSPAKTFAFLTKTMTGALQPFEKTVNASQVWFLDTSRDLESFSVNLANTVTPIVVTQGSNSITDLEDVLQVIGLRVSSPIPNVIGAKDSNEVILDLLKTRILNDLAAFYVGVNVSFTFTAPGTFPSGAQVVEYNSFTFSQMCLGGSATTTGNTGVGGLAIFDPHNTVHENDCLTNFNGSRLGVFLHTMVNVGYLSSASSTFATTFNEFAPTKVGGGAGVPIGSHVDGKDGGRLNGSVTDGRATNIGNAISQLARSIAVLIAHECGHSLGLVKDGAMPDGLYGNNPSFGGSTAGHINMSFGGNAISIMSPSLTYPGTIDLGTKFNSLNLAYLREAAIYN